MWIVGNPTLSRGGRGDDKQRPKHAKVINVPMSITETHSLSPCRVTFPKRFVVDCRSRHAHSQCKPTILKKVGLLFAELSAKARRQIVDNCRSASHIYFVLEINAEGIHEMSHNYPIAELHRTLQKRYLVFGDES